MKINWIYNPFINIAGVKSLVAGLLILLASAALGAVNKVHFDGVIDVHAGFPAPLPIFIFEVIFSWALFSLFLYLSAIILSPSKVRAVDVFGTQALAKYPYLLISLLSFIPYLQFAVKGTFEFTAPLLVFALISFVITVWTVILMFNAYSVSANLKGAKAIVSFIVAMLISEIIFKIVLIHSYNPLLQLINSSQL